MTRPSRVTIVDVGLRDGFQSIGQLVPTAEKLNFLAKLHAAGVRRVEATAFVSESAMPQMADAPQVLKAALSLHDMDPQVLVPNRRHAERAIAAGATHLAFVLSVSESHNRSNVRQSPHESVQEFAAILDTLPADIGIRINLATAFDCPFEGPVDPATTLALMDNLVALRSDVEICPCDTTGRVTPDRVSYLLTEAKRRYPQVSAWAYHGHDTYGLGLTNVVAAWQSGVSTIDASFAGLGGCPFAPGATGNVATEDVVWMFEKMGVSTGIDIKSIVALAVKGVDIPGAQSGGRVRTALLAGEARCGVT